MLGERHTLEGGIVYYFALYGAVDALNYVRFAYLSLYSLADVG